MQSSLVHVPCKSGSPHGVFGGVHVLAAAGAFGAAGAGLGAWAKAGSAVSTTIAMMITTRGFIRSPSNYFFSAAFSAARAPLRELNMALFPSWHAYSKFWYPDS